MADKKTNHIAKQKNSLGEHIADNNLNQPKEDLRNFLGFFELLHKIDNRLKKEGNDHDKNIRSSN